jgi:hypothetical protein
MLRINWKKEGRKRPRPNSGCCFIIFLENAGFISMRRDGFQSDLWHADFLSTGMRHLVWALILIKGLIVIQTATEWFEMEFCWSVCVGCLCPRAGLDLMALCPSLAHNLNLPRTVVREFRGIWEWANSLNAISWHRIGRLNTSRYDIFLQYRAWHRH